MISNEMRDKLIAMARDASQNAYVPYLRWGRRS